MIGRRHNSVENIPSLISDTNPTRTRTPLVIQVHVCLKGIEPLRGFHPSPLGMQTVHTDGFATKRMIINR
jgi:hypothetical protein